MLILALLEDEEVAQEVMETGRDDLAAQLGAYSGLEVYPGSVALAGQALFFLGRWGVEKRLGIISAEGCPAFEGEGGTLPLGGASLALQVGPLTHANACALRAALPYTAPAVVGLRRSVGCGDRLGLATPGHLRAVRRHGLAPVLAQQSIREMARTGRTPADVLDAATWGVFEAGWRGGFGADADHLKTTDDVDRCADAGFTWFTLDPSAYVDDAADTDAADVLRRKGAALPWDVLETTEADLHRRYAGRTVALPGVRGGADVTFTVEPAALLRAAAKYGGALAHTVRLARHVAGRMGGRPFELELSVDETETPTSLAAHYVVAAELRRLGVPLASLAPRFPGRMEKGVDYRGDLAALEAVVAGHAAVAAALGPYKLSLHSGSDKFSVYPLFARHAGEAFHLKTAGTSYLEALRAAAAVDPGLFREVVALARDRYDADRATYHVSADPARVPAPEALPDHALAALLDQDDARQLLHVTFGSALAAYQDRLAAALRSGEEAHYRAVEAHFDRHLAPFD